MIRRRWAVLLLAVALLTLTAGSEEMQAQPLRIGYGDSLLSSGDAAANDFWRGRAVAAGASAIRVNVSWASVAPRRPSPSFAPTDPASPEYRWEAVDTAVRGAAGRRLQIMLTVGSAPSWAEGPGRPAGAKRGTWRPNAAAFGDFATALASRYSGGFPDPLVPGATLPRVRLFEVWNEPNLDYYLAPQWEGRRQAGAELYRGLLNSFYAAVKRVRPDATVAGGAMAPFGDEPGGSRTRPVTFLRTLLCLRGGRLRPIACPRPAHLDALSHHPIAVGPPTQSALSPLDVTTPDLGKLTKVLRRAEQTHRVRPAGPKPLWVTEIWYDSNPPDPQGLPLGKQARWYQQALHLFWKAGASLAIIFQLRDSPPGKGYPYTLQSGAYFVDGTPKPSKTALGFPFVAERLNRSEVRVWGIAPRRGTVRVQARRGGRWQTLVKLRAPARPHPFSAELQLRRGATKLRARLGARTLSLPWAQR